MVDYSKWKKIEISDDEDDTHPNIDTASLFRWRHDARLQRMEEQNKSRKELLQKKKDLDKKLVECENDDKREKIRCELEDANKKLFDLDKRETKQPWNVDTISHDTWSNTHLNRNCLTQNCQKNLGDDSSVEEKYTEEKLQSYSEFIEQYEPQIKEFAFHSKFEDCRQYLLSNPNIVCEHTLDYMSLWCMQLEIDKKHSLLEHVLRQTVMIQMILDLAKTASNIDPRSCLPTFFTRAKVNYAKFQALLEEELEELRKRVLKAAEMRIEKAIEESSANPQELVGPGGLNVQEVFDSLPPELQKCFETRDPELLKETLTNMGEEQAEYHMQRCIDAGLWTPHKVEDEDEMIYHKVMEQRQNRVIVDCKESDDEEEDDVD